jgi:sec-independent protein translocase protein TatB
MFDIGWTEMLVIAIVMIVVVGPKDLPKMLRTFGRTMAKMRSMAGDFQRQFNDALKEAELDDVKKSVDSLRGLNPTNEIKKHLNPFEKASADVRAGLDAALKPPTVAKPASTAVHPAEPLKNGAINMPDIPGPTAMPTPPPMPPTPAVEAAAAAALAAAPVGGASESAVNGAAVESAANGEAKSAAKPKAPRARKKIATDEPAGAKPVRAAKPKTAKAAPKVDEV